MAKEWIFDTPATRDFAAARQAVIRQLVSAVRKNEPLSSALDVGCGVGYFSAFLSEMDFRVVAVDGRQENIDEAKLRHPAITFLTSDAEFLSPNEVGTFDFVLCVGLLYHLENPFRAIRNLYALTDKVLFIESAIASGDTPTLQFLDEPALEDQGLNYISVYPTESSLLKMLYRAGFQFVYTFATLPAFPLFQDTKTRKRERTLVVAAKQPLAAPNLILAGEPKCAFDFWSVPARGLGARAVSFVRWFISTLKVQPIRSRDK